MIASPASATRFELVASGTLLQSSVNQTLSGLPFGTGSFISGRWVVDIAKGTPVDQVPPGSPVTGQARLIGGAVSGGFVQLESSGGTIILQQGSDSLGEIYALNDVAGPGGGSTQRLDQLQITDGARATPGGIVTGYTNSIGGFLPSGVFLGAVSFGRVTSGTADALPTLLTSLDNLDPFALWQTGPYTFGLNFRQGSATTQTEYLALPRASFSVTNLNVSLSPLAAVPEPSSWAMLIAGFGLVGAVMRRRRLAAAW